MFKKIIRFFLKKHLLKKYYEEEAERVMEEYLQEDKTCIGIYNSKGKIVGIEKLKVI